MAAVPRREKVEAQIARVVGRALAGQRQKIVGWLGDPPNVDNITAERWDELARDLRGALGPELQALFVAQAEAMLADLPAGVDWALVNAAAANWASAYTFDLVTGINETSRSALQSSVSAYFEQGQTIGQLEDAIAPTFGPVRAESIAVTEVTRAASQGESEIARELRAEGIELDEYWETDNDELVCPVCGAAHGKERNEPISEPPFNGRGWGEVYPAGPPAHPR